MLKHVSSIALAFGLLAAPAAQAASFVYDLDIATPGIQSTVTTLPAATLDVDIYLDPEGTSLGGYSAAATYDTTFLSLRGAGWDSGAAAAPWGLPFTVNTSTPGRIAFNDVDAFGVATSGLIIRLTFNSSGTLGDVLSFGFDVPSMSVSESSSFTDVPFTTQDGTLTYGVTSTVPLPAGLPLLGAGLLGLGAMVRRRTSA